MSIEHTMDGKNNKVIPAILSTIKLKLTKTITKCLILLKLHFLMLLKQTEQLLMTIEESFYVTVQFTQQRPFMTGFIISC